MKYLLLVSVFFALLSAPVERCVAGGAMHPEHAPHAMVVSMHELASRAGVEALKAGGNAIDAAVATGFALAVVHPEAGNIGGGGFMLIRMGSGETHFLDYREKAPGHATETLYQDAHGKVIPNLSVLGYKAVGVPGSVKGMVYAEQHFGKLGLSKVMQPAIRLAREGFPLSWGAAKSLTEEPDLRRFPDSRRIFQNGGKEWHQGDLFKQPELARTLERISANPDEFYTGAMAREIAEFMQKGGGILTTEDLAHYEVKDRVPVHGAYRGLEIISAPPPSSGGTALVETLNILEGFDLAKMGLDSAQSIHLITEAYRRAFLDRAQFMGDPDFSPVPVAELTDRRYGAAWRGSIDPQHASASLTLRRPALFPKLDLYATQHPLTAAVSEPKHTTHYSVVDAEGNAVAVTTTINDEYGSRVTLGSLGFLLNNEMDDFAAKVGVPNLYGLIQGQANAVGPDKRPLSAMTPTIVLKGGKLWLVLGAEGGPTIITQVGNILIRVVDFGLDIQEAVNSAHFHNQWMPDALTLEPKRISPDTVKALSAEGNAIEWDAMGDAECIQIDLASGERLGASDGRNENGRAVGY